MGNEPSFLEPLRPAHHRSQITTEKIICHSHRFVYVAMPKVASRSLLSALERAPIESTRMSETWSDLYRDEVIDRSYQVFTFVRNPWARLHSTYSNKIASGDDRVKDGILRHFPGLHAEMSFLEFANYVCHARGGNDVYGERHWISQHLQLPHVEDGCPKLTVGRIETLRADFDRILLDLGLDPIELPTLNTRFGWRTDTAIDHTDGYRQHYDSELAAMVGERYATDIEMFGYQF